jgi:amidase
MPDASLLPDPLHATIAEIRAGLDTGAYTARDLVQAALERIAAIDRQGPSLNAVAETNPEALALADALDAELAAGTRRGPLHGIPVLLKDNIATGDGMENTAGSLAMVGAKPTRDAFLVERLREAGAIVLGKTNLSEWANLRSPLSSSGWSGRGGQVRNPHQLDRNPSGSSSGSGVAVAAGYAVVALGSETNGSIVSPANASGVVGIKPTVGLTSRMGVIPISHHQDTVGPMARTVADAAAVLTVIAVPDPSDPAVAEQADAGKADRPGYPKRPGDGATGIDYASSEILDADGLRGARVGVWRPARRYSRITEEIFEASLAALRDAGAELVEVEMGASTSYKEDRDQLEVLLWEIKPGIASYIERYVDPAFPVRTLADIVAFNTEHADEELRWFGQEYLERALEKAGLDDPAYTETLLRTQRHGRQGGIDGAIEAHRLDAIVAPSGSPATRIDHVNGDHHLGGSSTLAAIAGYPIVTVPAGSRFGLPLNVSFIGGAFTEPTLIRLAYAFEQATRARIVPRMAPAGIEPPCPSA